jgi:hypothetical protein
VSPTLRPLCATVFARAALDLRGAVTAFLGLVEGGRVVVEGGRTDVMAFEGGRRVCAPVDFFVGARFLDDVLLVIFIWPTSCLESERARFRPPKGLTAGSFQLRSESLRSGGTPSVYT